jgi:hypothetical protein
VAKYGILHGDSGEPTWHLAAVRQENATLTLCPLEHFLCVRSRKTEGLSEDAQRLALTIAANKESARAYLLEECRKQSLLEADALRAELPQREHYLRNGFEFQNIELTAQRAALKHKERNGENVKRELDAVIDRIRHLDEDRAAALADLLGKPDTVLPGSVAFIAHALVLPEVEVAGNDPWRQDNIEALAMNAVRSYESDFGDVRPVHTPKLARAQGLQDYPGFDVLSFRSAEGDKRERRCIEVKGTRGSEAVEMSENEWDRAMNLRSEYWLYVVAECASPAPRLIRIQDPAWKLLVRPTDQTRTARRIRLADILPLAEGE